MPEVSRFYGIVIRMYFGDHNPLHFHAAYSGNEALININTLAVIAGRLPPRAMGLVAEWATRCTKRSCLRCGNRCKTLSR